jgi:hypothetical protein
MDYEARHSPGIHWALAIACLLLSTLGFAAAGVIPTASGSSPMVGWAIVGACFGAAIVFVRRATSGSPQVRIDASGVWTSRRKELVPWSEIERFHWMRAGYQRIARFSRRGRGEFGVNTTFYDRGIDALIAAVRHHRPDLFG